MVENALRWLVFVVCYGCIGCDIGVVSFVGSVLVLFYSSIHGDSGCVL